MQQYYHGTHDGAAHAILTQGFSLADEQCGRGWGDGVYLSGMPAFAATWGDLIVVCTLRRGARMLWHDAYDPKVIARLHKEFGADIVQPDFWKALPRNKQFTKRELTHLWHYLVATHYTGQRRFAKGRYERLVRQYSRIYEQLRRHQFAGVGFRADAQWPEMLVFNPADVRPESIHRWSRLRHRLGRPIPVHRLQQLQQKARRDDT